MRLSTKDRNELVDYTLSLMQAHQGSFLTVREWYDISSWKGRCDPGNYSTALRWQSENNQHVVKTAKRGRARLYGVEL